MNRSVRVAFAFSVVFGVLALSSVVGVVLAELVRLSGVLGGVTVSPGVAACGVVCFVAWRVVRRPGGSIGAVGDDEYGGEV